MARVVMLAGSLARGGAETQLVRLASGLRRRGHLVVVATILPGDELRSDLDELGIPVTQLSQGTLRPLPVLGRAVGVVRRHAAHAVVGFDHHASLLARLSGRLGGADVVVSSIRIEDFGGRARRLALRWTAPLATVTVTNSVRVADALVAGRLDSSSRLRVIPNGLDIDEVRRPAGTRSRARAMLGVPPDTFLWLAVGNLRPTKDYPTLLAALDHLRGDRPACRVVVAGGGEARAELQARAVRLGVAEMIEFLGPRRDVPELLAAADALVLSSSSEGLPNAVMEAEAAGLPVVATTVSGVPELVEHGRSGLLAPPRDPAVLGTQMQAMMDLEPEQRAEMGEAGRRHVMATCDLERYVDAWEHVLLEGRRSPVPSAGAASGVT